MYSAVHRKSQTPATVWVVDKKPIEKLWFKKDAQGYKRFMDYLRVDALPPGQVKIGVEMYEKLEDDSSYYVYVTERVVGSLFSMYYSLGDLTLAKTKQFTSTEQTEQATRKEMLRFTSPDSVLFGLTKAVSELSQLHAANTIHGNITPSSIVVT